jgi:hypothetical protein
MWNDFDGDFFWSLAGNFIRELNDFSRFLFEFEAKGSGRDTEVNARDLAE